MFDRLSRSFVLLKASATVLKSDRHLLVFPLISGCAMLIVLLCFALPMFGLGAFDGLERGNTPLTYSLGFLFYVVQYFIIFYFNAALVGCVLMRMDGGAPTVKDGLRLANSRFATILGYAIISATVGVILRTIQERVGFLGRFITGLFGVLWNVATFLVVPVLVARDVGPAQSIKDSASLLKRTWGENVVGQVGLGLAFSIIQMAIVFGGVAVIGVVVVLDFPLLAIPLGVLIIVCVLATVLFHSALSGIYSAVLYRYASNGDATVGFDSAALSAAFLPKK
ncbi:MAG: hypothetical protein JWR56_2634 [Massilia sp.]|jgi:hypothetical protein|nr:hypothetical protein [Massilia sp.]